MTGENVAYSISLKDYFSKVISDAEAKAQHMEGTINNLGNELRELASIAGIAFGIYEVVNFGEEVLDVTTKLETLNNVINYTSIDTADAAKNHEFLNRIITDMRLPLIETTEGFSKLNATMMGTKLAGEETRKIFEGVSIGATAMHLSAEEQSGVFLALSQMMSKGKVSAEELRGQLAERLPGALKIAADAMGVTQAKLGDMMKDGELVSAEFLPKFAAELRKTFEGAIPKAVLSLQALRTENANTWLKMKAEIGEASIPMIHNTLEFSKTLADLVKTLYDLRGVILAAAAGWAVYYGATVVMPAVLLAVKNAQLALNTAMLANPYLILTGLVVTLILQLKELYDWNEKLYAQYNENMDNSIIKAKQDEIKAVNDLADAYAKKMPIDKARRQALMDELEIQNAVLAQIESSAGKFGLAAQQARVSVLSRKDIFSNTSIIKPTELIKSKDKDTARVKGTSHTTVNMTINKLVETLNFVTNNLPESASKIKEEVAKALMEAAMDAQILARG